MMYQPEIYGTNIVSLISELENMTIDTLLDRLEAAAVEMEVATSLNEVGQIATDMQSIRSEIRYRATR